MVQLTFINDAGDERTVDAHGGISLMEIAVRNQVDGIDAICGGACCCATCHVYVDADWSDRVGLVGENEAALLETITDRRFNSRLSCQITVTEELDGLTVRTPGIRSG
jgi:2Fe-2S ferredoxin